MSVRGVLLAAGAGRRYGGPKALVPGWLEDAVAVLSEGGCEGVTVVLGAAAEQVVVPGSLAAGREPGVGRGTERGDDERCAVVDTVVATDWAQGMGASLNAALASLADAGPSEAGAGVDAALVHLVDLPDVTAAVVERLLEPALDPTTLRRAAYRGVPGHPVLLGRAHWDGVRASAVGDTGARDYLRAHRPELVECGDLATGRDVDRPTAM